MASIINNRSDIEIEVKFIDKYTCEEIPVPDYDFELCYSARADKVCSAWKKNGVLSSNCKIINGRLHIYLDSPKIGFGYIRYRHIINLPRENFPDNVQTVSQSGTMPVKIVGTSIRCSDFPLIKDRVIVDDLQISTLLATEENDVVITEDGFLIEISRNYGSN